MHGSYGLQLNKPRRAFTYTVTIPPVNPAVSLADVKANLRVFSTAEDDLIQIYIDAATEYAEKITRRWFITRTAETFRDSFDTSEGYYSDTGFEIRRSKLQSVTSIVYSLNNVETTLDAADYYVTSENDYSEVKPIENGTWPEADQILQAIKITFTAGFGTATANVPKEIQFALMQIVAAMYNNRGDCASNACNCANLTPPGAKAALLQYRIENL